MLRILDYQKSQIRNPKSQIVMRVPPLLRLNVRVRALPYDRAARV